MTIDEAIKHCLEVTNEKSEQAELWKSKDEATISRYFKKCAADHRQLLEWLMELKDLRDLYHATSTNGFLSDTLEQLEEAKRLLKAAVKDFQFLESHSEDEEGNCLINYKGLKVDCKICPLNNNGKCDPNVGCRWNHEAEALNLIGDEKNEP